MRRFYSPPKRNLMDLTTYTTGQGSVSAREQNSSAGEDAGSRTRGEQTLTRCMEIDVAPPRLLPLQPRDVTSHPTGSF